jgi:hypothetical protein
MKSVNKLHPALKERTNDAHFTYGSVWLSTAEPEVFQITAVDKHTFMLNMHLAMLLFCGQLDRSDRNSDNTV